MRELTVCEMAELDGEWGFRGLFEGFLCGAGIITSIAIWVSPDPVARWAMWSVVTGTIGICALAFFD
jgi:hypothetical protein